MAKYTFKANSEFETLTHDELKGALDVHNKNWFREMARGVKHMRTPAYIATPAGGSVTIGTVEPIGPNAGFLWAVQRLSVFGLTTNDTIQIYRGEAQPANFIANLTAAVPFIFFGDKGLVIKDSENLVISGTTASTGQIVVTGEYVECASVDSWKLISNG